MPDARGFLLPDEKRKLLRHFAPVLVLFPEDKQLAPYPDEGDAIYTVRGSYHPRAVEFFLNVARLRYKLPVLLRNPLRGFFPRKYTHELAKIKQSITPVMIDAAVERFRADPRYVGLDGDDLREAIRARLLQELLCERVRGLDLPIHRAKNLQHWKAYFRYLGKLDAASCRSVVYGRVVQGLAALDSEGVFEAVDSGELPWASFGPVDVSRSRVALQYWFHYYYDDWANRHEGDLESITLLLDLDAGAFRHSRPLTKCELLASVTVLEAGYSSHEDGYRRRWADVHQTAEGRPVVYVARGSSASYFEWRREGYPASARVGFVEKVLTLPGLVIGAQRFLGRRWDTQYSARFTALGPKNTDWVAADPDARDRIADGVPNTLERLVPRDCCGVRRVPGFDEAAGHDNETYFLETEDLFWLEVAMEYGLQWGQDSLFPGTKGPRGLKKSERNKKASHIDRLVRLERRVEQALAEIDEALSQVSERKRAVTNAIPQLDQALRQLRPASLQEFDAFPPSVRKFVYTMWAWILEMHPEAWPGGPGLLNRWRFARQLRPGLLSLVSFRRHSQPLLDRQDPLYHIKTLLAQVLQTRYEAQHDGSKWDNPFSWVRYTCRADTYYYGRQHRQTYNSVDFQLIDCEDVTVSMK